MLNILKDFCRRLFAVSVDASEVFVETILCTKTVFKGSIQYNK